MIGKENKENGGLQKTDAWLCGTVPAAVDGKVTVFVFLPVENDGDVIGNKKFVFSFYKKGDCLNVSEFSFSLFGNYSYICPSI